MVSSQNLDVTATVEAIDVPAANAVLILLTIAARNQATVRVGSIALDPNDRGASMVLLQHLH